MNLINAAARAWDKHRLALSDTDRTVLTSLNTLQSNLRASTAKFPADPAGCAAGGATDSGSVFAKVEPALEAQYRQINSMATLRTALVSYSTLCTSPTASTSK